MSTSLVTGAQGFLGRWTATAALAAGENVAGIGRSPRSDDTFTHTIAFGGRTLRAPTPETVRTALSSPNYAYHAVDLLQTARVAEIIRHLRPRAIVHLASALRDDDPHRLVQANILATISLFDAIRQADSGVECIVLGSSSSVYGAARRQPISERAGCKPQELYGVTKLAAEHVAATQSADLRLRVSYARLFNLVGPGQDERHVCGKFASQAVAITSNGQRSIQTGDLRPTRDFIDARDAAQGILTLVRSGAHNHAYNVCSRIETPIADVLRLALRHAGADPNVTIESAYRRDVDVARNVGDNARLRKLGWEPRIMLEQSIGDLVAYYRSLP